MSQAGLGRPEARREDAEKMGKEAHLAVTVLDGQLLRCRDP